MHGPEGGGRNPFLRLDVPADPQAIGGLRRALGQWLHDCGVDAERSRAAALAAYEALANSFEHAYHDGAGPRTVDLCACVDDSELEVVVSDRGRWRSQQADPIRGRGIPLIHALAERAWTETTDAGTTVRMLWQL